MENENCEICGKKKYNSLKEANTAKNTIKRNSRTAKTNIPKRAYWSKTCSTWHLTHLLKE